MTDSPYTVYAIEAFVDEAAQAAGKDPRLFHHGLLAEQPRPRGVPKLAAEKTSWDPSKPLPAGRERRVAVTEAFRTFAAQTVEVSVDEDGKLKVEQMICAMDYGAPINPDVIAAQMGGGIDFGLGAVLRGTITLKDGEVEQNNFDSYQVLQIAEVPKAKARVIPFGEVSVGVSGPNVTPTGLALANAAFATTGQCPYNLPFPTSFVKA